MNIPIQAQSLKKFLDETFENLRKKYNLTMNEVLILVHLVKFGNKDTAKDIVEEIMMTKSHISKSVKSLVDKKIITRVQDVNDKKVIHLQIINQDSDLIKEISKTDKEINKKIIEGISDDDLIILEKSLKKIKENIKKLIIT